MGEKPDNGESKLYHERQVKELCALHTLNNLMQTKQAFTKKDLDDICCSLSPGTFINPHRSILGLGNYDVNVLMAALKLKGFETIWFDKRKDVEVLVTDKIMGFILNTPIDYKLGFLKLPLNFKHWIAIRWLQGQYMNLDSKLDKPVAIGSPSDLLQFLRSELSEGNKELFLVVEESVYEGSTWRRDSTDDVNSTDGVNSTDDVNSSGGRPACEKSVDNEGEKPADWHQGQDIAIIADSQSPKEMMIKSENVIQECLGQEGNGFLVTDTRSNKT